jgi:hypothetical protein
MCYTCVVEIDVAFANTIPAFALAFTNSRSAQLPQRVEVELLWLPHLEP